MELNRELTKYSTYKAEQAAYEAMQMSAFKVADALIKKGNGSYAEISGSYWWVSPVDNKLEIVSAPDDSFSDPESSSVFLASGFDGLAADDLDNIRQNLDIWLDNPTFLTGNQTDMNNVVNFWYENNNQ
jgi:hypothetical protein